MASSSLSHRRNEEHDAFSGIEPQGTRRKVDESPRLFDVFINHRGPDVKQTVALQLHSCLTELGIHTFLDSEEKELGVSFPSTIESAIYSSSAHIAIFSNGYAESPWCLTELLLMLQSEAKIFPVFYQVKPSDLRYIEKGGYAKAFTEYKEKRRYMEKLEDWKKALESVSFIAGYEISSDFKISDCQNIVSAVLKEVQRTKPLHVAKYPVGLHKLGDDFERLCLDKLVKDYEKQCWMNEAGKEKAQIVGIVGMGGAGKTTLAKELFNRKQLEYRRSCFLFDVREAYANNSFPSLQMKLLRDLFEDRSNFQCTEEGKARIADCIRKSKSLNFLIVIDDIDHLQQLDALLIMDILKKSNQDMLMESVNSLVIITTRDLGLLENSGISAVYKLQGMNRDDAKELFCWHAFGLPYPVNGYQDLVNSFLDVCGGLPLSLQVLGSHVYGRDQNYWRLEFKKFSKTLPRDVHQRLKISFDALDYEEQQIFMDIACFFVDKLKSIAMEVWEASEWSAQHALETLKNKCLVQEIEGRTELRMHDHLRDLGIQEADGLSHPRRLWRPQHLKNLESKGFQNILAQAQGRCFHSFIDKSMDCRVTYLLDESDVTADTSTSLLWLELQGFQNRRQLNLIFNRLQPCILQWIPLQNLRVLIIRNSRLKTLWQSHVQVPTQLKELQIYNTSLKEFPDLSGISNSLEKIIIENCNRLKTLSRLSDLNKLTELNISKCIDLKELSVVHLSCLEKIVLNNCYSLKTVSGISLEKLVKLDISESPVFERLVGLNSLKLINVYSSSNSKCFELDDCRNLETMSGHLNFVSINIRNCPKLEVLPSLEDLSKLETLTIEGCDKLNSLLLLNCQNLKTMRGKYDMARLVISDCPELVELPCVAHQTRLEMMRIVRCGKLHNITLPTTLVELVIEGCGELKTVAAICDHSEHLELQEKSNVARLNCLMSITIETCDKLQTIQGIDELHALKIMELSYCSSAVIQNCIPMLKSVPSELLIVIGRTADEAQLTLNPHLFSEADAVIAEIDTPRSEEEEKIIGELSAVIICAVVVVNDGSPAEMINTSLADPWWWTLETWWNFDSWYMVQGREYIITIVITDRDKMRSDNDNRQFEDVLASHGLIKKKGYKVGVKKGEEGRSQRVINTIIDSLYSK